MARTPKPSGRKRRDRSLSDIARKAPFRQTRRRILIVCEGEKTEPDYFNTFKKVFRLTSVTILVDHAAGQTSPVQIVNRAISRWGQDSDLDEVWCVFDKEITADYRPFNEALELAHTHQINLAVSNPAFEYWCLLHYEFTSRPFSTSRHLRDALRRYIPDYEKKLDDCRPLLALLDTAEGNAERVLVNHSDEDYAPNPSTYVHLLTLRLKNLEKE